MITLGILNGRFATGGKGKDFGTDLSILIMLYHVLLFTNYLHDNKIRYDVGWSISGCVMIPVLVLIAFLIHKLGKQILEQIKNYYAKRNAQKNASK
jgi:hypothetical protein